MGGVCEPSPGTEWIVVPTIDLSAGSQAAFEAVVDLDAGVRFQDGSYGAERYVFIVFSRPRGAIV